MRHGVAQLRTLLMIEFLSAGAARCRTAKDPVSTMRPRPRHALLATTAAMLLLAGCAGGSPTATPDPSGALGTSEGGTFPLTLEHAFGESLIPAEPARVAAVGGWTNHEAALALGVVPVIMPKMTWGDDDDDGLFPWVEQRLTELGAEPPTLFDDTEGIDFEAVADADPDVVLAGYSGLTEDDYAALSQIAPVVAYEDGPWASTWQETTRLTARALGLVDEGEALLSDVEEHLDSLGQERPGLAGVSVILNRPDINDLSTINFYTLHDPRAQLMLDLGLTMPSIVVEETEGTEEFAASVSAEEVDRFADVDVIMSYGTDELLGAIQADPLVSRLPPVANGSYVILPDDTPLAAAISPSPLSLTSPYTADLLDLLAASLSR